MVFFMDPPRTAVKTDSTGNFVFIMNWFFSFSYFYLFNIDYSAGLNDFSP